ncbi:MAG: T9SS type A sorting domain-containing protein [Salinivirgaceae bacterium]
MKILLTISIFLFYFLNVNNAQELIRPLTENPELINYMPPAQLKQRKQLTSLPFFDDFSANQLLPSADNWTDQDVYINNTFGIGPMSLGVATFDAVDANGFMYETIDNKPVIADRLTSRIIDLSTYSPADSLYLTFFYQPQGMGDSPEFNDSLILEFLTTDTLVKVWYANGSDFNTFKTNVLKVPDSSGDTLLFKMVHLKVDNPLFFSSSFHFRFSNYASTYRIDLNGSMRTNCDMWNIDYVYFNANRTLSDTIFADVAFVKPPRSFIKTYSSVPWAHFDLAISKIRDDVYYNIRNNDQIKRNLSEFMLFIRNEAQSVDTFRLGLEGSMSGVEAFTNYVDFRYPWSGDNFPVSWYPAKKATIEMEARLGVQASDPAENNVAFRTVEFDDYYAYDDGTAEFAYGVFGETRQVACYFETYKPDTLFGFSMYFVPNKENFGALQNFYPHVWTSVNEKPGEKINPDEPITTIEYSDQRNQFVYIPLSQPVYVDKSFFIGWEQNEDLSINLGFDANTNTRTKRYYYNDGWHQGDDDKEGSLMLRPVFAKRTITAIAEENSVNSFSVYPNPSTGNLHISFTTEPEQGKVAIFNSLGIKVFESGLEQNSYNLSHLPNGVYLVRVQTKNGSASVLKWMKH